VYFVTVIFEAREGERIKMDFVTWDPFPKRAVLASLRKTEDEIEMIESSELGPVAVRTHCINWRRL